jgi:SAM-dependent methyltransferase
MASIWHYRILDILIKEIDKSTANTLRIGDIGCDNGIILLELAKKNQHENKYDFYGIDYRKAEIEEANSIKQRLKLNNITFDYDFFLEKDFSHNNEFDYIVFSEVYEHLVAENQVKSLRIIGTILKDKGTMIMSVPNGDYLFSKERVKSFNQKYDPGFFDNLHQTGHWLEPKMDELRRILISLGFDLLVCRYFKLPFSGRVPLINALSKWIEKLKGSFLFPRFLWGHILIVAQKNPNSPLLKKIEL